MVPGGTRALVCGIHAKVRHVPRAQPLCEGAWEEWRVARFQAALLAWFTENGRAFLWRRPSATDFQVVIAELLLQRTRAEAVASLYPGFLRAFPSWRAIDRAGLGELELLLRPFGLWRRRSVAIHALAGEMSRRHGRFPRDRSEIESLPGIGQYIANAVLLFCHGQPQPLLDVNMARVLERVFGRRKLADIRYDPYLQGLASVVIDCCSPKQMNWAILDLAAMVCRSEPRCTECPARGICRHACAT